MPAPSPAPLPLPVPARQPGAARRWLPPLVAITLAVVAARLVVLALTPLDLFYDEAQYWAWAQELAFGYFSKPPLIALQIAATTALCGDGEACVRVSAPLLHGATTLLMFGLGTALYGARTGFLAALGYLLAFAVSASSLLISTDVALLAAWVAGLWALVLYARAPSVPRALAFGLAIAIGLNAKYAMIYFPLCALLWAGFTRAARPLLRRGDFWLGIGTGLTGFVPNLLWNIDNAFITFAHTGTNIAGEGLRFDPVSFLGFFGSQFLIAGPILFGAFLWAVARRRTSATPQADGLMLWFSLPILALLGLQAFQSQANPNWAATAFPAVILLATAILADGGRMRLLRAHLVLGAVVAVLIGGAALAALAVRPDNPVIARTNLEDMFGWSEHAAVLDARLDELAPDVIVLVGRRYAAGFAYYLRHRPEPLMAFRAEGTPPQSHFELTAPWSGPAPGQRAVILQPFAGPVTGIAEPAGTVEAGDGARPFRSATYLYLATGG